MWKKNPNFGRLTSCSLSFSLPSCLRFSWRVGRGRADRSLPDGNRSMTGWLSTCSVALPPLRVNRTTWYLPSLTVTALSSMMMSSVPTLKITPIFPRSYKDKEENQNNNFQISHFDSTLNILAWLPFLATTSRWLIYKKKLPNGDLTPPFQTEYSGDIVPGWPSATKVGAFGEGSRKWCTVTHLHYSSTLWTPPSVNVDDRPLLWVYYSQPPTPLSAPAVFSALPLRSALSGARKKVKIIYRRMLCQRRGSSETDAACIYPRLWTPADARVKIATVISLISGCSGGSAHRYILRYIQMQMLGFPLTTVFHYSRLIKF